MSALDILKRLYAENDLITGRSPADLRLSHVLDHAAIEEIAALTAWQPARPEEATEHLGVAAYCMDPSPAVSLIEAVAHDCSEDAVTGESLVRLRMAIAICDESDHPHIASLLQTVLASLRQPRLVG